MPRRLNSSTVKRASPGRSIRSGPAIRSGSRGLKNPAMGPRASGGITRVSSRQCTASVPSDNSTRNESKLLRTDQSIELPMSDATSLAESTTESGPVGCLRRSTLVCVLARALGVGAPTVSATGGSLVECTPNTCAAWRRIGSRNHHAASAVTRATTRIASRNSPLRRSEEHTSELQSRLHLVCRLLLEKKKKLIPYTTQLMPSRIIGKQFVPSPCHKRPPIPSLIQLPVMTLRPIVNLLQTQARQYMTRK